MRFASPRFIATVIFIILVSPGDRLSAGDALRTIALTGTADPVTGASFNSLTPSPILNNAGEVAFAGALTGEGVTSANRIGVWHLKSDGNRKLFSRTGDLAPGADASFRELYGVDLRDDGSFIIQGRLTGVGVNSLNDRGVWAEQNGELKLIARTGSLPPGTSDAFREFSYAALREGSRVVFNVTLNDLHFNQSIWRVEQSGQSTLLAKELTVAPGTDDPFGLFNGQTVNKQGRVALLASFSDIFNHGYGVWSEGLSDGLKLLGRTGSDAPGTSARFDQFGVPILDGNGHTSFVGYLQVEGAVIGTNNSGIWSDRRGQGLTMEYRAGVSRDPVSRSLFTSIDGLEVNSQGEMAFRGIAAGRGGIWSEASDGSLRLVVEDRTQAPGTSLAFSLNNFNFGNKAFNGRGQMAFQAVVSDPTSPRPIPYDGIWAQDVSGELRLIAVEGQFLDVSDDPSTPDLRQIRSLSFYKSGFNDLGQVAFHATFADGASGIFLSAAVAVPEPLCAAPCAGIAGLFFYSRRRKKRSCR